MLREEGAMRKNRVACCKSPTVLITPLLVAGVVVSAGIHPAWVPAAAHTDPCTGMTFSRGVSTQVSRARYIAVSCTGTRRGSLH